MNSLVTQASGGQLRPASQFDLSPQNFEQALTFSNYLAESDMVPKDFKGKPGNCLIAMQWGAELGLKLRSRCWPRWRATCASCATWRGRRPSNPDRED